MMGKETQNDQESTCDCNEKLHSFVTENYLFVSTEEFDDE
jgi:hypothetical protein